MPEPSRRLTRSAPREPLIYPPAWYINLVQSRLTLVSACSPLVPDARSCNEDIVSDAAEEFSSDNADHIKTLALALELIGPYFCLESLPLYDQAYVLGLDVNEVRASIADIAINMAPVGPADTLIVEDEAAVALDLVRVVRQGGHRVCGTVARPDDAIAAAARIRPRLVLADVQLGDEADAGIVAVREIWRSGAIPVVYVTAYPERVREDAPEAIVIAKPFAAREVQTAIWRALYRQEHRSSAAA